MTVPAPGLTHSFTLRVELGQPIELGPGRAGQRRIIPITGGTAEGPDLNGRILNLGADWQTLFSDGSAHLDTRYAIEAENGAVIEVVNVGARSGPPEVMAAIARGEPVDPSSYTMRTAARLESGDPAYSWVNHTLFVCAGLRHPDCVEIAYYKVT